MDKGFRTILKNIKQILSPRDLTLCFPVHIIWLTIVQCYSVTLQASQQPGKYTVYFSRWWKNTGETRSRLSKSAEQIPLLVTLMCLLFHWNICRGITPPHTHTQTHTHIKLSFAVDRINNCAIEHSVLGPWLLERVSLWIWKEYFIMLQKFESENRGNTAVNVLCKSEGRWIDPSWCHCDFSLT